MINLIMLNNVTNIRLLVLNQESFVLAKGT